jgi:hypothetical protein
MGQKFPFGTPENLNALTLDTAVRFSGAKKYFLPLHAVRMRFVPAWQLIEIRNPE